MEQKYSINSLQRKTWGTIFRSNMVIAGAFCSLSFLLFCFLYISESIEFLSSDLVCHLRHLTFPKSQIITELLQD